MMKNPGVCEFSCIRENCENIITLRPLELKVDTRISCAACEQEYVFNESGSVWHNSY